MDIYKLNFTILELELLSFLSMNAGEKLSQRELSIILGVSPTAIANSVKKLKEEDLINIEAVRNIKLISYNRNNRKAIMLKRIENQKNIYLSGLSSFLEEKLAGATIILFGSYARGEDSKGSDIDIAIIGRKNKVLEFGAFEKTLMRKININYYVSWNDINKQLKNNILSGIVLSGGVEL